MMRSAIAATVLSLLVLAAGCAPPPGYHTSSLGEALLTTAVTVANYPVMVVPRDAKWQAELEREADERRGKQVVPEAALPPDTFLLDPARNGRAAMPWERD